MVCVSEKMTCFLVRQTALLALLLRKMSSKQGSWNPMESMILGRWNLCYEDISGRTCFKIEHKTFGRSPDHSCNKAIHGVIVNEK